MFYLLMMLNFGYSEYNPWSAAKFVAIKSKKNTLLPGHGLIRLAPQIFLSPNIIYFVHVITRLSFVFAAIGFGGRTPVIFAAIGFTWLSNAVTCISIGWKIYLVSSWTACFLCLSDGRQEYSVDLILSKFVENYMFTPITDPILNSNIGPTLAFYHLCWSLTGAGFSKIRRDIFWATRLPSFIRLKKRVAGPPRWPWLADLIVDNPWLGKIMGTTTLIAEMSALAAMIIPSLRPPLLICMLGFHIGVALTLPPIFYHQSVCYLVFSNPLRSMFGFNNTVEHIQNPPLWLCPFVFALTILLLISTIVYPIDCFPLSEYAFYTRSGRNLDGKIGRLNESKLKLLLQKRVKAS